MDNRIQILLPNERSVTSENVDMFLNIDLYSEFKEFKKERFDNDFDLAAQFVKERNASRDFIIYGMFDSTVIDCDGLIVKAYSDSGRTNLISVLSSNSVSYSTDNVFGKRKGKYYIKLINYKHDVVYFRIESNNFSYKRQEWSQRVVFRNADGDFVPYGTQTVDVNIDGTTVQIDNDFPFFFNKHWIKNDYDIIEEKRAKVSFNIGAQTLREGESGSLTISLDKPSPFGLEMLNLTMSEDASFSDFYLSSTFNNVGSGNDIIIPFSSSDPSLLPFAGQMSFIAQVPYDKAHLISDGVEVRVLNGSYIGYHTILYSTSINITPYSDLYVIVLNVPYNEFGTNGTPMNFRTGTMPDISFSINGSPVDLPIGLSWQTNERSKILTFTANTDFEVEFTEYINLELVDLLYVKEGRFVESKITYEDNTPRRYVQLFMGPTFENYLAFTGRTYNTFNSSSIHTMSSYSILRNGYRFENRNEEFYPSTGYVLKVKNDGNRTVFPANPDLGIHEESLFGIDEVRTISLPTRYAGAQKHTIKLQFRYFQGPYGSPSSDFAAAHGEILFYSINGLRMIAFRQGYNDFKKLIDGSEPAVNGVIYYDHYERYHLERPFEAQFDDTGYTITLTSTSPGVRLDFVTNDELVTATTINNFTEKQQLERSLVLLANSEMNTQASYSFSIEKVGYRTLNIPRTQLIAGDPAIPYYLVTSYGQIMRPYYDDLGQSYYGSASTIDDQSLNFFQIDGDQPSYMPRGTAFINGVALLSDNVIPYTNENLTNYGLGEGMFIAGFFPQRLTPILSTNEVLISNPTTKVMTLRIPYSNPAINNDSEERMFDFKFGTLADETTIKFGGNQLYLRYNMEVWWLTLIPAMDLNGDLLPNATVQERMDIGNSLVGEGPVSGVLLDINTVQLTSKQEGHDFNIVNIVDTFNGNPYYHISTQVLVPHLLTGDVNVGNNGLGGFLVTI